MKRPPKPTALKPILENIPQELKDIPRWVCWKIHWSTKVKKWIKLPLDAKSDRAAKSTDPKTWCDYDTAAAAFEFGGLGDGVGFVFNGDGIVGLDFDKCFDPTTGEIAPGAVSDALNVVGYWEISPSGNGLHCFTRATLEKSYTDNIKHIEMYPSGRFFTVTGHTLGDPRRLPPHEQDLSGFVTKHFPDRAPASPSTVPAKVDTDLPNFFRAVNDLAMRNFATWVPMLFPTAEQYQGGYRVHSADLNRDLEEDISIVPEGIKDFGLADMGDDRHGKRTAIDLVQEHYAAHIADGDETQTPDVRGAALWLCRQMQVDPKSIGYEDRPQAIPGLDLETNDDGMAYASVSNLMLALKTPGFCSAHIGFDTFRAEIMLAPNNAPNDWRPFTDGDYVRLRMLLEQKGFLTIGREIIRDVVGVVSEDFKFDSAILWLENLKWDGTQRCERFLVNYFGVEESAYANSVSLYTWTALAGRVLCPGCKADMVPILIGAQGIGKSSAVAAMVPSPDYYFEVHFDMRDEDTARKMRGRLIGEAGELRGLQSRDAEAIKEFITRTHENWIPKYREFAITFPRRCLFIGTTNADEFLSDETGNRRWLPVLCVRADVDAIRRDLLQLWAEAREMYSFAGIQYQEAETLAVDKHDQHMISDSWEQSISTWLEGSDDLADGIQQGAIYGAKESGNRRCDGPVDLHDVLTSALNLDLRNVGRREELRAGKILRGLGMTRRVARIGNRFAKRWFREPCYPSLPFTE